MGQSSSANYDLESLLSQQWYNWALNYQCLFSANCDFESHPWYNWVLDNQCLLPDIGIDESLLKYSGLDSNAVLQDYSNEMLKAVPGLVQTLGPAVGALTSVPNAVGLGALVISMIIEIAIKSSTQTTDNTYGLLRRVFAEEKASSVRDTMSEYLRRHRIHMHNSQRLREEIRRLEQQLSNDLTILRNSLQLDGQMRSRGFKIWVNGAAFYVQMLIHEARLNIQIGKPASNYLNAIEAAIDLYLGDLDNLMEKHKTYKINSENFIYRIISQDFSGNTHIYIPSVCLMKNDEANGDYVSKVPSDIDCSDSKMVSTFMDFLYSNYEPIKGLKSYFLNIKENLKSLIHQRGSFTLPSAAA